ncbi:MAG: PIN domain-containing protein [Firmicutes bacterium]|nr:PIN domain-containing protein [Bacillota bacterium]
MNDRFFVDTNILVYAYDRSEPSKQEKAIHVLDWLAKTGRGVISVQVLSEFFVSITRKLTSPLDIDEGLERVDDYIRSWKVVDLTSYIVLEAIRGVRDHGFSFWDAQIWATARLNQIPVILSEDFNPSSVIDGVLFLNPFDENFNAERWFE